MIKIKKNTIYHLEILLTDIKGNPVGNEPIQYLVYKCENNKLIAQGNMTYIDRGMYQIPIQLSEIGQHKVLYEPPTGWLNSIEEIIVIEDYPIDTEEIAFKLNKLLGLDGENQRTFNMLYDVKGRLISADCKIYLNKSDTEEDKNPIAHYRNLANYDSFNKLIEIKRVKL